MALHRESVIRAAEKYVARGKLEAAIKEYRKVLAENPTDANTLNRVGDLYARIERFDEAVKLFSQIAEQYTRDGFFVKAIAIYKKIIKLDPTSLSVYERLAELYHKQGLLNEARTQYQVLADYYVKHDNAASAITIYQRMAEFEPDNPSFHLKLAELFESQLLIDKAMREYRLLADLLIVGGSVDEAVQVYLKALEVSSSDLDFVRDAVSGLHDTGHVGGAAKVLAKAVGLNPGASDIARRIGLEDGPDAEAPAAPRGSEKPEETTSFEIPDADDAFDISGAFASDQAFELPEASFDEIHEALEETGIPVAMDEPADEPVFTFDLDDDEPPASLVTPPADMLEPPEQDLAPSAEDEDADDFDIDLDFDITPAAREAGAAAAASSSQAFEIDWPLDGAEELELPLPSESGGAQPGLDLDDTVPAQRAARGFEPVELDALELGDPSPEPVEHVAGELPAAGRVEIQLEAEDFESAGFEATAFESTIGVAGEAAGDDAAQVQAQFDQRREEDLLAEAKVFFKYGLHEKARDRLGELFQVRPDHLEALDLQARLDLDAGHHTDAMASANLVARLATGAGDAEIWAALRATFAQAGFTLEGERVIGEPGVKVAADDRIAQLLDDLSLEAYDVPVVAAGSDEIPIPSRRNRTAATLDDEDEDTVGAEPGGDAGEKKLVSLAEELGLDDLEEQLDQELAAAPAAADLEAEAPVAAAPADPLDETGMSWLDELEPESQVAAGDDDKIFEEEDDFFDLAAELERELSEDQGADGGDSQAQEQSLEDIIEGFKQGVAENLSPEDYDTHFNLGIAYREMGLLDEAIGEFQLAAKDERFVVDSSSLLGICFLDKGLPELAVRSFRKGLESPTISPDATLGLLYDMGAAYLTLGDADAAYKTFVEVYGLNSHYRDVAARLQELKGQD